MTDWATVSSLATAGGTLVLAIATFATVRFAKRAIHLSEMSFQEQLRPMLVHSHLDDPEQRIIFGDGHMVCTPGGGAVAEVKDGVVYLALSIRNVGAGIGVLQAWYPWPDRSGADDHVPIEQFRTQVRDFYIPPGGVGLWQGALRDPAEDGYAGVAAACAEPRPFRLELLYSDSTGSQRTVSRFLLSPGPGDPGAEDASARWTGEVIRTWHLDRQGPR